jgi:hypothetical protein
MNFAFSQKVAEAAKELAEALSITQPPAPPGAPPFGATPMPGAPPAPQGPPPAGGLPQGGPPPMPPAGGLAAPSPMEQMPAPPLVTAANPLQGLPSFKSPPMAAFLQKAAGSQGPVGFAKGGRVRNPQRSLAVQFKGT